MAIRNTVHSVAYCLWAYLEGICFSFFVLQNLMKDDHYNPNGSSYYDSQYFWANFGFIVQKKLQLGESQILVGESSFVQIIQYLTTILCSICFAELRGIFIQRRWSLCTGCNDGVQREMNALLGVLTWTSLTQALLLKPMNHFVRHSEDDCGSLPCILKDWLSFASSHQ